MSQYDYPKTHYQYYYSRMDRLLARGENQRRNPDSYYVKPFRIAGNIWYIGNKSVCSHLIDTGDGLIIIDTSYPEFDYQIFNNFATFDIKGGKTLKLLIFNMIPSPEKESRWKRRFGSLGTGMREYLPHRGRERYLLPWMATNKIPC